MGNSVNAIFLSLIRVIAESEANLALERPVLAQ